MRIREQDPGAIMVDATALPWLVAQHSAWLQLGEIAHIVAEVQLDFFAALNQ